MARRETSMDIETRSKVTLSQEDISDAIKEHLLRSHGQVAITDANFIYGGGVIGVTATVLVEPAPKRTRAAKA